MNTARFLEQPCLKGFLQVFFLVKKLKLGRPSANSTYDFFQKKKAIKTIAEQAEWS